jgi:uncharacterized damage-inducible protein DinB
MKRNGQELFPFLQAFGVNRRLTYDLLEQLTEEELQREWPRPGLNTFSKHFQEMASVQLAFISALTTGVMDFSSVPDVFAFPQENDKSKLKHLLTVADQKLEAALSGEVNAVVRWDDIEIPVEGHLNNLVSHEVFHQGQMTLALYLLQLPIPQSWQFNWALPAFVDNKTS